ncbi:E3 ubiquitin-protein ligase RFWD3-like isoform X2 [Zingiber officinale]|uniref:E3 ubiquitin-protein ligase RFWD3-like isoform X2 n=1 Tax=Zingiber officinale TaxID=94328 RepID=UPI001C4C4F20|nr:E3 ubiquitin-protein ligase RFWD3-like isoform X2 [Zingiber officinale]
MEVEEAAGESSIARNIDLGEDEPLLHDSGVEDRVARQEVDSRAFSEVTEDARERMHDGEREVISLGESDGEDDADGQSGREEPAEEEGAEEGNERGGAEGESLGKTETVELDASSSPNCPVCFEPWKGEGLHRVCCVPCGHVYGRSCLERWLKQCGKNVGKCPQCSKKFRRKEIVNLYAPVIAVPNADLEKEVQCLKKENMSLKIERNVLLEEINKQKKRAKDMECFLINKMACVEHTLSGSRGQFEFFDKARTSASQSFYGKSFVSQFDNVLPRCCFTLQNELELHEARVMGIDGSSHIVIVSGKSPGIEREHVLNKISLLSQHASKIELPPNTSAIKDLRILPNGLALLASLGKKLLLYSMASNNLALKYDLPAPAWSCCGDKSNSHSVYAGLQNGMLLVFDIRQTSEPMQLIEGLTSHPVHSVDSVVLNDGSGRVFSASSSGPCVWEVGFNCRRPFLIPEMQNRGVCISLACCGSSDTAVATFRPKFGLLDDITPSQLSSSPVLVPPSGKVGSHVLIEGINDLDFETRQIGTSAVSNIRMPKSAICSTRGDLLFTCGDETTNGVHIWQLPFFNSRIELKPHPHPILDVRYDRRPDGDGLLGCISDNRLQVFNCCST